MSEFGKGLAYCLGLFLAHAERKISSIRKELDYELWFNGAADHLYELQIPDTFPKNLKNRLTVFQDKCLNWRITMDKSAATEKDFHWAIQKAKDLLLEIDKHFGIKVKKGQWE